MAYQDKAAHTLKELNEIMSDAGLYREYVAVRFGQVLTHGGHFMTMDRAMRHVKRIAKMTGLTVYDVLDGVRSDYNTMDEING